jgi:hypothetical protein
LGGIVFAYAILGKRKIDAKIKSSRELSDVGSSDELIKIFHTKQ